MMDTIVLQFGDDETPARAAGEFAMLSLEGATHLGLAFFDVARARGDHPAIETEKGIFTYGWLLRAAESVRRYLHTHSPSQPRIDTSLPKPLTAVSERVAGVLAGKQPATASTSRPVQPTRLAPGAHSRDN